MTRPHLLLFDDNPDKGDITRDTLDEEFEVEWVLTEEQLDDKIERNRFSVIATDVSIETSPKSGYEIVDSIRRKLRITRTPVVVYSAVRNVDEIRKAEGNQMYYDYVEKIRRGWQKKLLDVCKNASEEDRHLVSWNTFEAYFKKIGKLDDVIPEGEITDAYFLGIDLGTNPTNRTIIELLKNPELVDPAWETIEKALWNRYCRYKDSKN